MSNFIAGTKIDIKDTYKSMVDKYKEVNDDDDIEYIWDYIEELHMLLLQYNNVKNNLDKGNIACWTKQYWNESINEKQRVYLHELLKMQEE